MNNIFAYLLELNIALVILFVAYKIFFEKDKNFIIRRIYLMGVIILPFLLPLMPQAVRMPVSGIAPISINIEGVTVLGSGVVQEGSTFFSFGNIVISIYLLILAFGLMKLLIQLGSIIRAIYISDKMEIRGTTLLSNPKFHASSFFNYIFIDPAASKEDSFDHILEHESLHKREWHSIDRILVELFVMINWFNPVAWMFRKSVIENLEYLADSAVLRKGTDPMQYQLSILNQYIGSASISNQFSNQIKNRITMLNKNYKLGSRWKLTLLIPLTAIALFFVSCTEKEGNGTYDVNAPDVEAVADSETFFVVEEMPTFNGGEPKEFRYYIAKNMRYPAEAAKNGVSGKIFIKFFVNKEGKVVVPDQESLSKAEGKPIDEVVVVTYRTLEKDAEAPEEKYIQMLKDEAIRVVSSSPAWTPGKQRGKNVKVMYTFPINFKLQ